MGMTAPRVPPSVIKAMREQRYNKLRLTDKEQFFDILIIMNNVSGGNPPHWSATEPDSFKNKDPNIYWCLKQLDRLLSNAYVSSV